MLLSCYMLLPDGTFNKQRAGGRNGAQQRRQRVAGAAHRHRVHTAGAVIKEASDRDLGWDG